MIVNIIVIFLTLILGFLFSNRTSQQIDSPRIRKKYIQIISFILILQSGLRNVAVGDDTYAYFLKFEEVKITSWSNIYQSLREYYQLGIGKDPGYSVFQKVLQLFTDEYQVFLFMVAVLFFVALGNFIYKNTTRLNDAILAFVIYSVLFYSFFSITGIRQTIVTAATLYGYEFIKRKKIIPFTILIILVSTIHKSVMIFLPFYFIARIKNPKYLYRSILLLFPLFMIFKKDMGNYLSVLGGYEQYGEFEGAGTYTFTAMFLLISIVALWRSKIIIRNNNKAQHFYNAFAIALLFIPLTWINPTAMRIVQYFSIFMLLFIPEIIHSFITISKKIQLDIYRFTIVLLTVLFVNSNWNRDLDYAFFWQEMRIPENYYIRD
jgi:transmembrane protein EpsG